MSESWGLVRFRVSMNATPATGGDGMVFYGKLTCLGRTNVTTDDANPAIGVGVCNSTGGMVWAHS